MKTDTQTLQFSEVITKAYHNVLNLEESRRKYTRTTTTFRGRNAMEYIYSAAPEGKGYRTQSEIADFLKITRPSCTTLLKKLEEQGYIYKQKNSDDERSIEIYLTRRGQLIALYQMDHKRQIISEILDEFPEDEQAIIYKGFARLNEVFENCIETLEAKPHKE